MTTDLLSEIDVLQKNQKKQNDVGVIPYRFAKRHGILITKITTKQAKGIYHAQTSSTAILEIRRFLSIPLVLEEVNLDYFNTQLTKQYESKVTGSSQVAEDIGETLELKDLIETLPKSSDLLESDNDAPVIRLINALLREAIKQSASDIHFETFEKTVTVRFRVDGILHNVLQVPNALAPLIISRLKVMAKLDISEKRLPQDGRITVRIADRAIDIRVSTLPISYGERVVLRLLDKKSTHLNLSELGMNSHLLTTIRRMIAKPHGIMLVTGPTGSGKTTTLYAALTELNQPGRNIMTIEDPIEYDLLGVAQTQVNPKVEMSFARGLRAILRQDPNIIMVGEIRDLETAIIAIQASLTGHLVLSTLHTNTAIGAITRLRDMGVESFLISSSLIGVVAQRLVRMLCPYCKKGYPASSEESLALGMAQSAIHTLYSPQGCNHCNQTGFSGRVGVYEVIEIDQELKSMIHQNESEHRLEEYARKLFPSILRDASQRVLAGDTSFEEIMRIISE